MSIEYTTQVKTGGTTVSVTTATTTLLPSNGSQRTVMLQNLSTVPVYVLLGDGCTTSNFNFVLPAGTADGDGTGGFFGEDTVSYTGIITACVATGTANVQATSL
jgi:hypothetical protein